MNDLAAELTGWTRSIDRSQVARADQKYFDSPAGLPESAGAYHLHYGLYNEEEVAERLGALASMANGRSCVARFRPMYGGKQGSEGSEVLLRLQGVVLGQGVSGNLTSEPIWYLLAVLKEGADMAEWGQPEAWATEAFKMKAAMTTALLEAE